MVWRGNGPDARPDAGLNDDPVGFDTLLSSGSGCTFHDVVGGNLVIPLLFEIESSPRPL